MCYRKIWTTVLGILLVLSGMNGHLATAQAPKVSQQSIASVDLGQSSEVFVDSLNQTALILPNGWYGFAPSKDALQGISVITNYGEYEIANESLEQEGVFPEAGIKIQIMSEQISANGLSFREIMDEVIDEETFGYELVDNNTEKKSYATDPLPYKVGDNDAYIALVDNPSQPMAMLIEVAIEDGKYVRIGIMPANSTSLDMSLRIINTLVLGETPKQEAIQGYVPLPASVEDQIRTRNMSPMAIFGACPSGTFPGNEAPAVPGTLHMPFRAGEYWRVGDHGSFFGNGYHCNSNNDYYATDWNRSNSNGEYQPDAGYHVLPVADGNVTYSGCITTGYGCHIKVVHNLDGIGGYDHQTIYAHLSSRSVNTNTYVNHNTKLGEVGSTGNSNLPHLHLSVRQLHIDHYDSHCNIPGQNCPNGEPPNSPASSWPQTDRPKNFFSQNVGIFNLVDGQWWQSENQ